MVNKLKLFVRQSWLGRMWGSDKPLFAVVVIYLLGLGWFALHRTEEFPFLLYGMYSVKEYPQQEYTSFQIKVDGKEVRYTELWDLEKELIVSPMWHALALRYTNEISENELRLLQAWIFRYIGDMRFIENNTLEVYRLTCRYTPTGHVIVENTEKVMEYHAD